MNMEWISVKDRLPNDEIDQYVLIYHNHYGIVQCRYEEGYEYCFISPFIDFTIEDITHWCLLENIPLSNQPEHSKRENIYDCCCKKCDCPNIQNHSDSCNSHR